MFLSEKADTVVFHYNKKHSEDTTIPPWIVKFKGKTHYINHFEIMPGIGFQSKETPDNGHTKASIKIKGRLEVYTENDKLLARVS